MSGHTNVTDDQVAYARFFDALLRGDRPTCRALFQAWLQADKPLPWLYQDVLQRALYTVGERWASNEVSVATEHMVTAIAEQLLTLTYSRLFQRPSRSLSSVVACCVNEYHQLGGKMVADFFEWHGWRSYFLGANTPLPDLLDMVRGQHPDVLVFSVTLPDNLDRLHQAVREVRSTIPDLPILVGGQAFRHGGGRSLETVPSVKLLKTLDALETWIEAAS